MLSPQGMPIKRTRTTFDKLSVRGHNATMNSFGEIKEHEKDDDQTSELATESGVNTEMSKPNIIEIQEEGEPLRKKDNKLRQGSSGK